MTGMIRYIKIDVTTQKTRLKKYMKTYRSRPDLQHRQNVEFNKKYSLKNILK